MSSTVAGFAMALIVRMSERPWPRMSQVMTELVLQRIDLAGPTLAGRRIRTWVRISAGEPATS